MDTSRSGLSRTLKSIEPEAIRLQKDAEAFTQRLEKERRLSLLLDDNIREMKKVLEQKQQTVKQVNVLKQANSREQERITYLETMLNRARLEVGDLQIHNRSLRTEIDSLRKNNLENLNTSRRLNLELGDIKEEALETRKRTSRSVAHEASARTRIYSVQENSQHVRLNFSMKVSSLENEILEDRKLKRELMKRLSNTPMSTELSESGQLTKHLYENWSRALKDKRKEVDNYIRYIRTLASGFAQMKEFSTMDDLKQIVTSFLNSLERQREIQKHLVILNEQIDEIQEELTTAKQYMSKVSSSETSLAANFEKAQTQGNAKLEEMTVGLNTSEKALKAICKEVEMLQGPLRELYEMCSDLSFKPELSEEVHLTDSTEFNISTAGVYLVQLEEITEKLLGLLKNSTSASDTNYLNTLEVKRFDKALDLSSLLDPETQPKLEEESYPIPPQEFRTRVRKILGKVTV